MKKPKKSMDMQRLKIFRTIVLFLFLTALATAVYSENVNIPDANFKAYLVANVSINTDGDSEISTTEAKNYTGSINVASRSISDLTGIEAFPNIIGLRVGTNNLTKLDVSNNTKLVVLDCNSNQLHELDVSNNTALQSLNCSINNLKYLNIKNGNNTSLSTFDATENKLCCITVDDVVYAEANFTNIDNGDDFSTNCLSEYVYIPDANLFNGLIGVDGIVDGIFDKCISFAEAEAVTDGLPTLSNKNITDLTGLEAFINITTINLGRNLIEEADFSHNTNLRSIYINNNNLTVINIDGLFGLVTLNVSENQLTAIDLSSVSLLTLDVSDNVLTSLDLSLNRLVTLRCQNNLLASLNINNAPSLANLSCNNNLLTALDITNDLELITLDCSNNTIPSLNLTEKYGITSLNCANNQITSLDLDDLYYCTTLNCSYNLLTSLPFSTNNLALTSVTCNNNNLSSIDVSPLTNLGILSCYSNQLTSLDVSANTLLTELRCETNQIGSLNLSTNAILYTLYCNDNALTLLDVRNGNNSNISTARFRASNNPGLSCISVSDVAYANANWTIKDSWASFSSGCTLYTVTFAVTDGTSPLPGAEVHFNGSDYFTDVNGEVEITTLAGTFAYIVSKVGYDDLSSSITVSANVTENVELTLQPIVTIPDANFKAYLVSDVSINTNGDGEIQVAEAQAYTGSISASGLSIADLTGIEAFVNIIELGCTNNQLTSLDVSSLTHLTSLICYSNQLTSLDVSSLTHLTYLSCSNNQLTSLDVRNGNNSAIVYFSASLNSALRCISVSDVAYARANWTDIDEWVAFTSDCSAYTPLEISSVDKTDPTCYQSATGIITITASGGTGSLEYSVNGGTSWQSSNSFATLYGGGVEYNVKVRDSEGIAVYWDSNPVVLYDPAELEITSASTTADNGSSNGTITVTATGGTGTITYSKDGGSTFQSSNVFSGLSANDYTVVVKDANDCETQTLVTVSDASITISSVSKTDVTGCSGNTNGSITVTATGGSGSLEYSVNNGASWQSSNIFATLSAGSYTVKVKDGAGSIAAWASNPVVITEPAELEITSAATTADNGTSNGTITVTATGGTGTITYSKDGGSTFQSSNLFENLASGDYTIVVKDANDCETQTLVTVSDASITISSVSKTDVTGCYGNTNGSITVTATGGTGSLEYSVNNGTSWQSSNIFATFSAGSYTVKVKDGAGSIAAWASNPVVLTEPAELEITSAATTA
ncbi:MAG: leucine-rich repeat domain-containing protein, partial [Draconibacterium sp.]